MAEITMLGLIELLAEAYGPRGWWPLPSRGDRQGRNADGYLPSPSIVVGPGGDPEAVDARFEIAIGAILAQNTSWRGASKALDVLVLEELLDPVALSSCPEERLAALIHPAGTYARKAEYLKILAHAWPLLDRAIPARSELLTLRGIGYETADCILSYGFGVPRFVADAYSRRILSRSGLVGWNDDYETVRLKAERALPADAAYLAEAHALLVEHAKRHCRARPDCGTCPLEAYCPSSGNS